MRRHGLPLTKIIATIGPASSDETTLRRLIENGVSIFRFNFSHGSLDDHEKRVQIIRRLCEELTAPVAILGDLQGPKIRLGKIDGEGINLDVGDELIIQRDPIVASPSKRPYRVSTTYEKLLEDVREGERVLINDGAVRLLITEARDDEILCRVTIGGTITSSKGVNLPESEISLSSLTERDLECVQWAVEHGLDFLALSFVRTAEEIDALRARIEAAAKDTDYRMPIIAKIELPRAVKNIDAILKTTDGIMVARGDLGVEMELARVPVIQRRLIKRAQAFGKPCVVATQMLESMIEHSSPTRAEMSDVANAIFDEVDCVMLSGETAVGKYPSLTVEYMRQVATHTESFVAEEKKDASPPEQLRAEHNRTAAIAHGVWTIVNDFGARAVVVWSQRGGGARMLSQNGFCVPIIAMSSDARTCRQMQIYRGVTAVFAHAPDSLGRWTEQVDAYLTSHGWAKEGDQVVLVAGSPLESVGNTNAMAIHQVGNADTGFARI